MVRETPRDVPFDDDIPDPLRQDYIGVALAAEVADCHRSTIQRHLRNGTLAGIKIGERKWIVKRTTESGAKVPAIDLWEEHSPGNPNWTNREN